MAKTPKGFGKGPSTKTIHFEHADVKATLSLVGAKKTNDLLLVPFASLTVVPGFNLRTTDAPGYAAHVTEIKDSMAKVGWLKTKPLSGLAINTADGARIGIVDGHGRYYAAQQAIEEGSLDGDELMVPTILVDDDEEDWQIALRLQRENGGRPLTFLERSILAFRMMEDGSDRTLDEIAAELQVTTRTINDMKVLMGAVKKYPPIRDAVKMEVLASTEVIKQFRKDPEGAGPRILELLKKKAASEGETSNGTQRLTSRTIEGGGEVQPRKKMEVHRNSFNVKSGDTFMFEDYAPFAAVIADESWFKAAKKQTQRVALRDVSVETVVRIEKLPEAAAEEAEVEQPADPVPQKKAAAGKKAVDEPPAKKPAGKKAVATPPAKKPAGRKAAAAVDDDPDLNGLEVPDISGIADRASPTADL